jgi:predicted permease
MLQDLKFGLRLLWKEKAFSFAALLTLALCIGANTAIFTVLDAIVLRGLSYPEPERLVTMYNVYPGVGVVDRGSNGIPDYLDRRKLADVFTEVALYGSSGYDVGLEGSPQRIDGEYVTPSYFRVFGIQPVKGRIFTEDEAVLGKEKFAILSERLWQEMFASDPNILGKDIRLSGVPYRIVGVMPARFGLNRDTRVWIPFAFTPQQTSDEARHSNNWSMVARLQPGVSLGYAQQRIDALNKQNLDLIPKFRALLENARFGTKVLGLKDEMVRDIRPTLYLLQAAVIGVLLIGCVNLANLMLVRSNVRMKELAIRFSLGAGRWRIGRQLLTESIVLAVLGGMLGVAVGYGGVRLLSWLGASELPRGGDIRIDTSVLVFTAGVALLSGILFGSVPLVNLIRRDLNEVFRNGDRTGTVRRSALWLRSALVVCQVSLAFVLLIGSGLLTLSFVRLLRVDPGFQPESVMTARVSLPSVRYKDDAAARNFLSGLLERMRSVPGVKSAALTTYLPFSGNNNASVITIDGRALAPGENPPVPGWNRVDGSYFAAMGIPFLSGRTFNESDSADSPNVVIIDEFLARKYWPDSNPIGAKIRRGIDLAEEPPLCTIVGVVGSVKTGSLAEQNPVGQLYFHYKQLTPRSVHVVLKGDRDAAHLTSSIRRELLAADPELPLFDTRTMPERISRSLVDKRAAMILCLIFGGIALMLASVGIYGVLAYSVAQRTREFGIRMALGAEGRDVMRMVVGQGLKLAVLGLAIGAAGALALTRLMTVMLYDVKPADPSVFVGIAFVLGGVSTIAALIPSLRAVRIRPGVALRYE